MTHWARHEASSTSATHFLVVTTQPETINQDKWVALVCDDASCVAAQ